MFLVEEDIKFVASVSKIASKEMDVFYNPLMKHNRDVSISVISKIKPLIACFPLAASGVRALRAQGFCEEVYVNDIRKNFKETLKKNIDLNGLDKSKFFVESKDASIFMLENRFFDYIDIDPFGSPNPFLDAAIRSVKNNGVLAITATDTAPLAGTYPKACKRKYWANPLRTEIMHEVALRILIRKIQLVGAQFDKALTPFVSYYKDHYYRVFFRLSNKKSVVDKILSMHSIFKQAGPMWVGKLNDFECENEFIKSLNEEEKASHIGFFDIHKIAKNLKLKNIPKDKVLLEKIRDLGFFGVKTHFSRTGIKTNMKKEDFEKLILQL
ncbi:MAG: hypothetical protein ACMXX7_00150 [Candidatus Woesearchaeota archaeon]